MTKGFKRSTTAAITAIALGAAMLAGLTASAQAGEHTKILTSSTWKPGYVKDEGNQYVKIAPVETSGDGRTTAIESRSTWAPGYRYGSGSYSRIVERDADRAPALVAKTERRDTWAPGFSHEGEGSYVRVTYVAPGAASGTMLAGDAGDRSAQVAEAR